MFLEPAAAAIKESECRSRLLLDSIQDYAIYLLDPLGHIVTWDRGAELNTGYAASDVLGRHFRKLFVPQDAAANLPEAELEEAARTGRCAGQGWRLRKSGERFWASFSLAAVRGDSGRLTGFAEVLRDAGEAKKQQDALLAARLALREERDCLYAAAECRLDALYLCKALRHAAGEIDDFVFTYLNGNVARMTSLPTGGMLGRRLCELFPAHRANGLFERYKQVVATGEPLALEMPAQENSEDGAWVGIQAVKHGDGLAITIADITARKRLEREMRHVAHHDPLTGLPNRSLLRDRVGQAIERARRFGGKVAVFMVDLDSFKRINDTFGHATGDAVLVTVGVRLRAAVRATDSVIRLGGDEFVVVMPDISAQQDILSCAEKILDTLQNSMEIDSLSLRTTCSVGFAVYPDTAQTVEELLSVADAAMYDAKRRGKNQYSGGACALDPVAVSAPLPSLPLI